MSLQIWLPLDGTEVVNRGIAPMEITENTLTYSDTGGKISSKCPTNGKLTFNITLQELDEFTMSFWIKCPLENRSDNSFLSSTDATEIYSDPSYAKTTEVNQHCSFSLYSMSTSDYVSGIIGGNRFSHGLGLSTVKSDKWQHIVWVKLKDKDTYGFTPSIKYKNGIFEQTVSGYLQSILFKNFSIIGYDNLHIQDFRLYDHALSEREIKQLSQGLMVHYPLADNMVESTTNLLSYPQPTGSKPNRTWDAELHKDAIIVSGWSDGWNGGVSEPTIGYHARWEMIDGLPTAVFPNLNSQFGKAKRWLGINSSGSPIQSKLGPNTTYTVSFDARSTGDGAEIRAGLYYWLTGASSQAFNDGQTTIKVTTQWKRYSFTETTQSTMNTSKIAYLYLYGHYGNVEGITQIRNIQIELKDHATAYTPTSRESILSDCSGNGKHGVIVGNCQSLPDSARYANCLYIADGLTNYGKTPTLTMPKEQITMSCWYKAAVAGYGNYQIVMSAQGDNYEMSITPQGTLRTGFRIGGARKCDNASHTSILDGNWHMLTTTYDGTSIHRYVDGSLVNGSTAATGEMSGISAPLLIGNYNGTTYGAKEASISDVRIYYTALSEADIKTLYESAASFMQDGSISAYQFIEDDTNIKFAATGINRASEFSEVGYTGGMKTKVMPDGSAWARIHWLDLTTEKTPFANANEVGFCDDKTNRFSKMNLVDHFKVYEPLPDGYTTIEYIESTGTQHIDTGYYWTSENTKIEMDATVVSNGASQSLFGNEEPFSGGRYFSVVPHGSNGTYGYYVGSNAPLQSGVKTCNVGERFKMECQTATIHRGDMNGDNKRTAADLAALNATVAGVFSITDQSLLNGDMNFDGQLTSDDVMILRQILFNQIEDPPIQENLFILKVNGTDLLRKTYSGTVKTYVTTTSTDSSKGKIYIFANHNSSSGATAIQQVGGMKLYSFKMYDNGVLVRDFIPVKNNLGEAGLWDRVTKQFFANAGTGSFVAGPEYSLDKYEFMLTYPSNSDTKYNRWIQSNSPNVASKAGTGYIPIHTDFTAHANPLTKCASSGSAVYCTNIKDNWWSPIGQLVLYNSTGIPAANGSTETEVELWVRIDNLPKLTKTSFVDDKYLQAANIYEI